ncbi:hypothetical protein [Parendozoicomonas haliclonae]|uniref:Uncharacterized protein n=1 Tax=Parendozoicomonas haliclonae TaxID=1960125 RepID=A0A1X7ATV7_9GAMM|nr:hypothetical protein [Parendozoicomonas haliclonae]SMA50857.1 hypothetical protein EHSB41UT_04675 [Parendozoicomonas haliclonae]
MSIYQRKPLLILILTLLIGCLLGALLTGWLVRSKVANIRAFTTQQGFVVQMEKLIQPNAEQAEKVREILSQYGKNNEQLFLQSHNEVKAGLDKMTLELAEILDEQQITRLETRRRTIKELYNRERQ